MKILILYTRLSGYIASCLKELNSKPDVKCLVFAWPAQENAPFDPRDFHGIECIKNKDDYSLKELHDMALEFKPDAVLVSGWMDPDYVSICRLSKSKGVKVISGMDNQWQGSFRQWMALLAAPLYVNKFIDVIWAAGKRQQLFARKLGYSGSNCWDGYYSCDYDAFKSLDSTVKLEIQENKKFLFVGRYVEEKGVGDLIEAYISYRESVDDPWGLVFAGAGPLVHEIEKVAFNIGFIQPAELPALMHECSAFILPSRYEPWGVVVHEAASAGLPLIVSDQCGAGDRFVTTGVNGCVFETGKTPELVACMLKMHNLSDYEYQRYCKNSIDIASGMTPAVWASILYDGISHKTSTE